MEKAPVKEERKMLLERVLINEYMSSDDESEENGHRVFMTRPIKWQSSKFRKYKKLLDDITKENQSTKASNQTIKRIVGDVSTNNKKPPSTLEEIDKWIVSSKFQADGENE